MFFSRIDKLDDEYEGTLPIRNQEFYKNLSEEDRKHYLKIHQDIRKWIYVNCWYSGKFESNLMWKAYSKNNKEAVAIQTTYQKLQQHLPVKTTHNNQIALGAVEYIDYNEDMIPLYPNQDMIPLDPFQPFMYKRVNFQDENEIRSLILEIPPKTSVEKDIDKRDFEIDNETEGIYVEVPLSDLIDSVYISPTAQEWFHESVDDITKKYGYNFPIEKSQISGSP